MKGIKLANTYFQKKCDLPNKSKLHIVHTITRRVIVHGRASNQTIPVDSIFECLFFVVMLAMLNLHKIHKFRVK